MPVIRSDRDRRGPTRVTCQPPSLIPPAYPTISSHTPRPPFNIGINLEGHTPPNPNAERSSTICSLIGHWFHCQTIQDKAHPIQSTFGLYSTFLLIRIVRSYRPCQNQFVDIWRQKMSLASYLLPRASLSSSAVV